MIGVSVKQNGRVEKALQRMVKGDIYGDLDRYGRLGVRALAAATPKETSETAQSWEYRIVKTRTGPAIEWYNTHQAGDTNTSVAVLIQYGHATRNGGYVRGQDYINRAMRPIFDQIVNNVWKKVVQ